MGIAPEDVLPGEWVVRVVGVNAGGPVARHATIQIFRFDTLNPVTGFAFPGAEYYDINGFGTSRSDSEPTLEAPDGYHLLSWFRSQSPTPSLVDHFPVGDSIVGINPNEADILWKGSEATAKGLLTNLIAAREYLNNANFDYAIYTLNSNSFARGILDAMGIAWTPGEEGWFGYVGSDTHPLPASFLLTTGPYGFSVGVNSISPDIYSGRGDDTLTGDAANNTLVGRGGDNLLDGGAGSGDIAGYADANVFPVEVRQTLPEAAPTVAHVKLNLTSGQDVTVDNRHGGVDTLQNIEVVRGAEDGTAGQDQAGADVVALSGYTDMEIDIDPVMSINGPKPAFTVTLPDRIIKAQDFESLTATGASDNNILIRDLPANVKQLMVDAGEGYDSVSLAGLEDGIIVADGPGDYLAMSGTGAAVVLRNVEVIAGTEEADRFMSTSLVASGGGGNDLLTAGGMGEAGNDIVISGGLGADGGDGDDLVINGGMGGAGNDVLVGGGSEVAGEGQDVFHIYSGQTAGLVEAGETVYFNGIKLADTLAAPASGVYEYNYGGLKYQISLQDGMGSISLTDSLGNVGVVTGAAVYLSEEDTYVSHVQIGATIFYGRSGSGAVGGAGLGQNSGGGNAPGYSGSYVGSTGDEVMIASSFQNAMLGEAGNDTLLGADGADVLSGGTGNDVLLGGAGADTIVADAGDDTLVGGDDFDTLDFSGAVAGVQVNLSLETVAVGVATYAPLTAQDGFGGMDFVSGFEEVVGSLQDDILIGSQSDDVLYAQAGNDLVLGGAGADTLIAGHGGGDDYYDGGADADTIRFESTTLGVVVNLQTGTADGAETGHDTLVNIEHVVGGSGKDTLTGNDLANTLSGGANTFRFRRPNARAKGTRRRLITAHSFAGRSAAAECGGMQKHSYV